MTKYPFTIWCLISAVGAVTLTLIPIEYDSPGWNWLPLTFPVWGFPIFLPVETLRSFWMVRNTWAELIFGIVLGTSFSVLIDFTVGMVFCRIKQRLLDDTGNE